MFLAHFYTVTTVTKTDTDTFSRFLVFKVGLGILQITSAKRCPQVWPWVGRSLFSTNFVEFDQAVW